MKKVTKTLLLLVCAVALVVGSIAGTLAWLQDTDQNVNAFTVGHVYIDMDEKNIDGDKAENGSVPERDKQNDYHLIPGVTVEKDPTVTVQQGSEEAYVYMVVTVEGINNLEAVFTDAKYYNNNVFLLQNLVDWTEASPWDYNNYEENAEGTVGKYLFVFENSVTAKEAEQKLEALFTTVTIPGAEVDNSNIDNLDNVQVVVNAYAVQAQNGNDPTWTAEEAWNGVFAEDADVSAIAG